MPTLLFALPVAVVGVVLFARFVRMCWRQGHQVAEERYAELLALSAARRPRRLVIVAECPRQPSPIRVYERLLRVERN